MNDPGAPDPLYVLARRVLLDALNALGKQRDAAVLVGAQAVYLRTGPAGLPIAEHTTDADIALHPSFLLDRPRLEDAMEAAGFHLAAKEVGRWVTPQPHKGREVDVIADLLVPEAVGGPGRRGARLGAHGKRAARKVRGLEAALVDKTVMPITSLEQGDSRKFDVAVAGPAALLVSKLHKIAERTGESGRAKDKDALDVLRLLRATEASPLSTSLKALSTDKLAGQVSREAVGMLEALFAKPDSAGSQMAARAADPMEPAETTAASCAALATDVLAALRPGAP